MPDPKWIYSLTIALGNMCLVLKLKIVYQILNTRVNDPSFPFVGVIEHTNFDSQKLLGQTHCYLSRYLSVNDPACIIQIRNILTLLLDTLRMFPFSNSWIVDYRVWR